MPDPVTAEANLTGIQEDSGSIPGLAPWVKDLALLWLWGRPAAIALTGPPSLGISMCLRCSHKKLKKKKKKRERERKESEKE